MDRLDKLDDCHEHVETIKADHGPMKNLLQDWYKKQLKEASKKPYAIINKQYFLPAD